MKNFILFSLILWFIPVFSQVPANFQNSNGAVPSQKQETNIVADSIFYEVQKPKEAASNSSKKNQYYDAEVKSYKNLRSKTKENNKARSASPSIQSQMSQKAEQLMEINPNHVESKVLYYDAGNYDASRSDALKQALKIDANHEEALYLFTANNIVIGDTLGFRKAFEKLSNLGYFPADVVCYSGDVLLSVPKHYTLITHGRMDTYGCLWNQGDQSRKDLTIVSLELLQSPQYRDLLINKKFKLPGNSIIDVAYLRTLIQLNPERKFAFSLTLPKDYLADFEQDLVPHGLVFLYQNESSEEEAFNANLNLNNTLKFLDCGQKKDDSYQFLLSNYLPMLMYLESSSKGKNKSGKDIESDIEQKKLKIKKAN